jgi:CheY-like chemotaxis protein
VAANGLEAIEALRRQPYDVALMDVQMPEMDGLEATRTIHQEWSPEARPRIIAMTANVMKEDREACLAAGMDDYLGKPIRVEQLIQALKRCPRRVDRPLDEPPREAKEGSVLDPAALDNLWEMAGGDPAFLAELIDTFLEDAPQLLAQIQQAVQQGDATLLRRAAHSLKSNSAEFGAQGLSSLCRDLEAVGKTGTVQGVGETVAQAVDEYEQVTAALEIARREL